MYIVYNGETFERSFTIDFGYTAGEQEDIYVYYDDAPASSIGPTFESDATWCNMIDYQGRDNYDRLCEITVTENTSGRGRKASITITWDDQEYVVTVIQTADSTSNPIWKDTYYTTDENNFEYYLKTGGEVIFHGKAYKMPGAELTKVNINKICQNYLSCEIEDLLNENENIGVMKDAYKVFILTDGDDNALASYSFLYDWSYEDSGWDYTQQRILSHPINGHYSRNMYKLHTYYYNTDNKVYTSKIDGNYTVCADGDWAIYYLNGYGGWDSFLIEGNNLKTDNITEHDYNRSFNNTTIEYEQGRYISEITTSFKFYTGWLSDTQADNLANNLLGSNHIYLHDLKRDRIMPAIITNTSNQYKTYANQGKKMVNYEVNVKLSQNKIRK